METKTLRASLKCYCTFLQNR